MSRTNEYDCDDCRDWSIGYGLDGGGYAFTSPDPLISAALESIGEPGCIVWDSPDPDYFPYGAPPSGYRYGSRDPSPSDCTLIVSPGPYGTDPLPEFLPRPGGGRLKRYSHGRVNDSDRDCDCYGRPNDPEIIGAAGEGPWIFTGNTNDSPHPECPKCEGSGSFKSPGGRFAWYAPDDSSATFGVLPPADSPEWLERTAGAVPYHCALTDRDSSVLRAAVEADPEITVNPAAPRSSWDSHKDCLTIDDAASLWRLVRSLADRPGDCDCAADPDGELRADCETAESLSSAIVQTLGIEWV